MGLFLVESYHISFWDFLSPFNWIWALIYIVSIAKTVSKETGAFICSTGFFWKLKAACDRDVKGHSFN